MRRNILSLIVLTIWAGAVWVNGEPTPSAERPLRKDTKKAEKQTPPAKSEAPKILSTSQLTEGWNYVKGEWIHSDGYKYVNGQVVPVGTRTHKKPPKPPSKALLNAVKIKAAPPLDPNSPAAKAAEKERNLAPHPASQTGTHL